MGPGAGANVRMCDFRTPIEVVIADLFHFEAYNKRRNFVRRLAICQDAGRCTASVPRDSARDDVARRAAARRDAA